MTSDSAMTSLNDSFTENTFGDLSYTFLEPVPNYLTCIICYGLLKDAVATECCGKMFCYEHPFCYEAEVFYCEPLATRHGC